jgi:hypothetical protein
MDAPINPFCGRITSFRGARILAHLPDMSRMLRAVRLALHPAKQISGGIL